MASCAFYRATCTMAEVPLPTPTQNPVPSTDIRADGFVRLL
nr:MAG TPA: hypothetical protein [Caudoviricetes sp.]